VRVRGRDGDVLGIAAVALRPDVGGAREIVRRGGVAQPRIDQHAASEQLAGVATDHDAAHVGALDPRKDDRRTAPRRVAATGRREAVGRAGSGLGLDPLRVPAGARVDIGVVQPAGADAHEHLAGRGRRVRPAVVVLEDLEAAMARSHDRSHYSSQT
jgi:hypothetical protein